MTSLEKHAQRTNLWMSLGEKFWKIAGLLGVQERFSAVALAAGPFIWGLAFRLYGALPWWGSVLIALALSIMTLRLYVELCRVIAIRGLKKIDLPAIGRDCQKFREDVFEFLVTRVDAGPGRFSEIGMLNNPAVNRQAMQEIWARGADYSNQTRVRAAQRFAHRCVALCQLFSDAGISPPDLWGFDHDLGGIAAYVGAVGELLERGLLLEARRLDPIQMRRMHIHTS